MRFTAGMDAGEWCSRVGRHRAGRPVEGPPSDAAPGADGASGADADGGNRAEEPLGRSGREDAVRVRWRGPDGREAVTSEMQLLAALEVAGIAAAPDVLGIEEDGYVRETAPPLARRGGRRAGGSGPPATGERLAQARAREDLEALVGALHERGWVLGAPRGRGLGLRADGHVIVLDLSGLRREDSLSARSADRHWIDTVLEDEERTLRRRVHAVPRAGAVLSEAESFPGSFGAEPPVTEPAPKLPVEPTVSRVPEEGSPLPAPRLRRARTDCEPTAEERRRWTGSTRPRRRGPVPTVLAVLADAQHRRTALLSAGIVLVLGLGTGAALTLPGAGPGPGENAAASAPAAQDPAPGDEAPVIEDPWALAVELAGARHAYLTGTSDVPVAAVGGAAEEEDERIRAAYEGLEVRGGGPVVHEAELVSGPDEDGTAVLRVLTTTEDAEVVDASGTLQEAQEPESTEVDLSLEWDGDRWRIQEVEAV